MITIRFDLENDNAIAHRSDIIGALAERGWNASAIYDRALEIEDVEFMFFDDVVNKIKDSFAAVLGCPGRGRPRDIQRRLLVETTFGWSREPDLSRLTMTGHVVFPFPLFRRSVMKKKLQRKMDKLTRKYTWQQVVEACMTSILAMDPNDGGPNTRSSIETEFNKHLDCGMDVQEEERAGSDTVLADRVD